jgi:hypothetical protein
MTAIDVRAAAKAAPSKIGCTRTSLSEKVLKVREPAGSLVRKIFPCENGKWFGAAMNAGADFLVP